MSSYRARQLGPRAGGWAPEDEEAAGETLLVGKDAGDTIGGRPRASDAVARSKEEVPGRVEGKLNAWCLVDGGNKRTFL